MPADPDLTPIRELLQHGMLIVPRRPEHTPESVADLSRVLNRALAAVGRSAAVRLDGLAVVVVLEPRGD